jgi:hypothetical protein
VSLARAFNMSQDVRPAKLQRTLRHPHNMQKHIRPFLRRQLENLQQFRQSLRQAERESQTPESTPEASEDADYIYRYIQEFKPNAWTLSQWAELLQLKQAPEVRDVCQGVNRGMSFVVDLWARGCVLQ